METQEQSVTQALIRLTQDLHPPKAPVKSAAASTRPALCQLDKALSEICYGALNGFHWGPVNIVTGKEKAEDNSRLARHHALPADGRHHLQLP